MKSLDEFLKTTPSRAGGVPCQTCLHPNRKEIDLACQEFAARRTSGETTHPWSVFLRRYLAQELGYQLGYNSLRRHLDNCCGKTIS